MTRLTSSIPKTSKALGEIAIVQKHYKDAVSEHRVLATATEIGLELLATKPDRLTKKDR